MSGMIQTAMSKIFVSTAIVASIANAQQTVESSAKNVSQSERRERYDFAMCELQNNPALEDDPSVIEDVSGKVLLAQSPYGGSLWLKAFMSGLEGRSDYAISINERGWDGQDCATSGGPWMHEEVEQMTK